MAGKWQLIGGAWVPQDTHTSGQPSQRGITPGQPPMGIIRNSLEQRAKDKLRKFDKVTDEQIKKAMQEDQQWTQQQVDVTKDVHQAREDLKIGKIKISPEVLRPKDKRIVPFGHVEEPDGTVHILPQYKVPEAPPKSPTKEETEVLAKRQQAIERVMVSISPPSEAASPPDPGITQQFLIDNAISAVKSNRSATRGRTI